MPTKLNCWEFMKCGREPGGLNADKLGICPTPRDISANGLNNGNKGGRICWAIAGTFCGEEITGTFAKQTGSCLICNFFKTVKREQGDWNFNYLKPGQIYEPPV